MLFFRSPGCLCFLRYFMFKEMVPEYVIPRMLNKEVIADPRSTVTVLFVLIDNFGEYTRPGRTATNCCFGSDILALREKQDPKSSLKFLNACFDKMAARNAKPCYTVLAQPWAIMPCGNMDIYFFCTIASQLWILVRSCWLNLNRVHKTLYVYIIVYVYACRCIHTDIYIYIYVYIYIDICTHTYGIYTDRVIPGS